MGLYIPNLKLPADGDFELWIAVRKDGSFTYNIRGSWQDGKQKAVSVPLHGDLIDAQEQMCLMQSCDYDTYNDYNRAFDMLDNAPTIIPASKED